MTECARNLAVYDRTQDFWSSRRFSNPVVFDAARDMSGMSLRLPALRQDAVLVVLQIVDFRSCRLWIDGSSTSVDLIFDAAEGTTAFGSPAPSLSGASAQWFHFYVSRNGPSPSESRDQPWPADPLPYPPSVGISDAIDQRLGECLIKAMRLAAAGDDRRQEYLLKTLLECLLLSLKKNAARAPEITPMPVTAQRGGLAPWQVRRAKQIMDDKLEEAVAIEELAAACRLSKSHFARAFKATTGQSPHRWHLGHRVEHAKRLMIESNQSLADIALVCGFADQSHFAKVFSRLVGSPPGTWRRSQERVVTGRRRAENDNIRITAPASSPASF